MINIVLRISYELDIYLDIHVMMYNCYEFVWSLLYLLSKFFGTQTCIYITCPHRRIINLSTSFALSSCFLSLDASTSLAKHLSIYVVSMLYGQDPKSTLNLWF